jgi:polysaccharide biosynthesis protein PslG
MASTGSNGAHGSQLPIERVGDPALLNVAGLPIAPAMPTTGEYIQQRTTRRRKLQRLALLLAIVALIAETVWLSPFTDGPASAVPRAISPIPLAEVQPYGVNTFLHKEVESFKKEQTLQSAQDLGVGWIKQQFPWAEIEYRLDPDNPFWDVKNNQNAWTKFDDIVQRAQRHNLRIIARIDSAPAWSHPGNPDPKAPPSDRYMDEFGHFVETFVTRYRGGVAAIQVWNEPNLKGEWATGRPVDAAEYTEMLKVAYEAAKRANPDIIVLAAPLATNNESLAYAGNLNEIDYLQGMYDANAGEYFDAMAANAYGTSFPPEDEPSRQKLNFRRVELLREVMEKNGDADKSVWFNEYGWNASPPEITNLPWGRVTPEEQGDYTVRGIRYAREHWPWAGVFTIWYLRQVGDIPQTQSDYYFMLVDPDFVNRPAYRIIQEQGTTEDRVALPGFWGPLSTPVDADARWRVGLGNEAPGGMFLYPSTLDISLDVQFIGTEVKLQLVPPDSTDATTTTVKARYYVAINGSASLVASDLPRDDAGAAYIDIPSVGRPTEIVLARGINSEFRTGRHTLTITAAADPTGQQGRGGGRTYAPVVQRPDLPGIGAISIGASRSYIIFGLLTLALLAGCGVLVWVLRHPPPAPETAAAGR